VDAVAGYTLYIDLIRPLISNTRIIQSAMTQEVDRVAAAIMEAVAGNSCAIVSSGDAGIYAMAGLALEICRARGISLIPSGFGQKSHVSDLQSANDDISDKRSPAIYLEIVPGIPALASSASLLGAPLTHDFACISLSDLLTPWKTIEKRLEAASMADFVIVLYNPKSKRRSGHLETAQQIFLKHRHKDTPVGIVTNAMRENQRVEIIRLSDLHLAEVTMLSTVFIGNSTSFVYQDHLITPRGYDQKYSMV
jgi:precorrin-3B C17-methyltransferase